MKKEVSHMFSYLNTWLVVLSSTTSMHGFSWYNRVSNGFVKGLFLLWAFAVIIGLPLFIGSEFMNFWTNSAVLSATEWKVSNNISFPRLVICNPLFFEKEAMTKYNLSNDAANYLTYAVKPDLIPMIRSLLVMNDTSFFFKLAVSKAEAEVSRALERHNLTVLELYRAMAIKCRNFIVNCEIQRDFYAEDLCCTKIFDPTPVFTSNAGVCFVANIRKRPTAALRSDNFRIWLRINTAEYMKSEMLFVGTDSITSFSPYFAFADNIDTPLSQVSAFPRKVSPNAVATVAIKKSLVDRSKLNGNLFSTAADKCMDEDPYFEAKYGLPYSHSNCGMSFSHFMMSNCSVVEFMGLKNVFGKRPCLPSDIVQEASKANYDPFAYSYQVAFMEDEELFECKKECTKETFHTEISTASGNFESLKLFLKQLNFSLSGLYDSSEFAGIEGYFETFEVKSTSLYRDGLEVFLSRVGGWLGLGLGASAWTCLEIIMFVIFLGKLLCDCMSGRRVRDQYFQASRA